MDNDFHQNESIFRLFDGLEVADLDRPFNLPDAGIANGHDITTKSDDSSGFVHVDVTGKATNGIGNGETVPLQSSIDTKSENLLTN